MAVCDCGPGWSVKGIINLIAFGMLWSPLRLDVVVLCCYAPGHSWFNPIERSWATLTKWLVGVVLPHAIKQLNYEIPKPEEEGKWAKILENAVENTILGWKGI